MFPPRPRLSAGAATYSGRGAASSAASTSAEKSAAWATPGRFSVCTSSSGVWYSLDSPVKTWNTGIFLR